MTRTKTDPRGVRSYWKIAAGTVLVIIAILLVSTRVQSVLHTPGEPRSGEYGMQDFRDAVYYPTLSAYSGMNPYNTAPYVERYPVLNYFPVYSPIIFILHGPFVFLPIELAQSLYFIASILMLGCIVWYSFRQSDAQTGAGVMLAVLAALVLSRPVLNNLVLGQTTLQVALFCFLALALSRDRPVLAGGALALATFKPTFGVPLAILLMARGDYRTVAWGVAIGLPLTTIPLALFIDSWAELLKLPAQLIENQRQVGGLAGEGPLRYSRIDLASTLAKLSFGGLSPWASGACAIAVLTICGITARKFAGQGRGLTSRSSTIILLGVLLSIYHQEYGVILVIPILIATIFGRRSNNAGMTLLDLGLTGCLLVPFLNYAATNSAFAILGVGATSIRLIGSLNGLAVAVALCIVIISGQREQERPKTPD